MKVENYNRKWKWNMILKSELEKNKLKNKNWNATGWALPPVMTLVMHGQTFNHLLLADDPAQKAANIENLIVKYQYP